MTLQLLKIISGRDTVYLPLIAVDVHIPGRFGFSLSQAFKKYKVVLKISISRSVI